MSDIVYQTTDLCTATTLSHLGCELLEANILSGGNAVFLFSRNSKLESILKLYLKQACIVEPSNFIAEYKRLKSIAINTLEPGSMRKS